MPWRVEKDGGSGNGGGGDRGVGVGVLTTSNASLCVVYALMAAYLPAPLLLLVMNEAEETDV